MSFIGVMQFKGRHAGVEWMSQRDGQITTVNLSLAGCELTVRLNDVTAVVCVPPEAIEALFDMFAASVADAPEQRQRRATTRVAGQLVDLGALTLPAVTEELRMLKQAIEEHEALIAHYAAKIDSADASEVQELQTTLEHMRNNLAALEAEHVRLGGG